MFNPNSSTSAYGSSRGAYGGYAYVFGFETQQKQFLKHSWSSTKVVRRRAETLPVIAMNSIAAKKIEDMTAGPRDAEKGIGTPSPNFGSPQWRLALSIVRVHGLAALLFFLRDSGRKDLDSVCEAVSVCSRERLPELALELVSLGAASFESGALQLTPFGVIAADRLRRG